MSETITRELLVGRRWSWGPKNQDPLTTSFYFGADGRIHTYLHPNERTWSIQDGRLHIYNADGKHAWTMEATPEADGRTVLTGRQHWDPLWDATFCLAEHRPEARRATEADEAPAEDGGGGGGDGIRLVIWDLDDTFWHGTLSEGGIELIAQNVEIVRALNDRGIVNAICSKNDHATVRAKLEELGLWDEFVFPEIAWSPKGALVKAIVRNAQLRPETVLFVDDNPVNLNEAKFYVKRLQTAMPDILPTLLDDPRFKGKPDPARARLARYRVLQAKLTDQQGFAGDNESFLRDSRIRVSFHSDVEGEFARIHDLVNRTNQLNFTKNRWPEDADEARARFRAEDESDFFNHSGYVKVADRYGRYGICGFYLITVLPGPGELKTCTHFLFSCRSMNMGVEQFVWQRLGRPHVQVRGEVISDIDSPVDWISVVEDADAADAADEADAGASEARPTLCIRGACEMLVLSDFLRTRVNTIEETVFAYEGWQIATVPRIVALHDEVARPENQAILARLPGLPPGRFETDLVAGTADGYVLSFSQETFQAHYRSRSTGMILPMNHSKIGLLWGERPDYTRIPYDELLKHDVHNVSREQWEFLLREFEFLGGFDAERFAADVRATFRRLRANGKAAVIVGLNAKVGRDRDIISFFGFVNSIVTPIAREFGFPCIDVNDFVRAESDLATDGSGTHYARHAYRAIAEAILAQMPARITAEAA